MTEKYIKTRSNYVLKSVTQRTDNGTILERDHMTISGAKGYSPTERPLYNESGFVFVTRGERRLQKKHKVGEWLLNDACDGEDQTVWSLHCLSGSLSKDAKIEINPNYESIRDFVYYGSAVDLIKSSITDIINKFPAEMYFSDVQYEDISGGKYYIVENEFNIDVATENVNEAECENLLRFMSMSYGDYIAFNGSQMPEDEDGFRLKNWQIENGNEAICPGGEDGNFMATATTQTSERTIQIFVYYKNGERIFLYKDKGNIGLRIRPNKQQIKEFFEDKLDYFEKILLDQNTNPKYSPVFITPYETDTGFFTKREVYTWPMKHDWNLDITGVRYTKYLSSLIELANFHDEYDTDNIWRSMTHEAIKNLDWTYTKENGNEITELENIDTTRIEPILKLYGRQYDDIKRYIDNIRLINNISYNKQGNIPDYFLSDTLNLSGWDVTVLNPSFSEGDDAVLYYGDKKMTVTPAESNLEFLRRLKLNGRKLLARKGTRAGIENILGLLGFKKATLDINGDIIGGDYKIEEYTVIATPKKEGEGYPKYTTAVEYNDMLYDEETPGLKNLPVALVLTGDEEKDYLIPWYSQDETYAGEFYFQMKGGWGHRVPIDNEHPALYKKVSYYKEPKGEEKGGWVSDWLTTDYIDIYSETSSNLKVVGTLGEMLELGPKFVNTNDVCYVVDISNFEEYFGELPQQEYISHYFALRDVTYWYSSSPSEDGWVYIENNYIDPTKEMSETPDVLEKFKIISGRRILYLESIVDNNEGNNPHIGLNEYDNGESYLESLLTPFKNPLEKSPNARFIDDAVKEEMLELGWKKEEVLDNEKCWFFTDEVESPWKVCTEEDALNSWIKNQTLPPLDNDFEIEELKKDGTSAPYDPEGRSAHAESASYSIVNVKKLKITFQIADDDEKHIRQYIDDKIMFYLTQMIPSTTILEINIIDQNEVPGGIPMDDTTILMDKTNQIEGMIYTQQDLRDGDDFAENIKVISTTR